MAQNVSSKSLLESGHVHSQSSIVSRSTLRRIEDPIEAHVLPTTKSRSYQIKKPVKEDGSLGKKVLEEEEYISAMEDIVTRDFFPDLHRETRGSDADLSHHLGSLDDFVASHTSEDNASFEVIQQKDEAERRRRLHWLYEAGDGRKEGLLNLYYLGNNEVIGAARREEMDRLLNSSEEGRVLGEERPGAPDLWRFRVRNQLMFPPELDASRDTCLLSLQNAEKDVRSLPASSQLMLPPTGTLKPWPRDKQKAIVHNNTRLAPPADERFESLERPHSPSEYSQADSLDLPTSYGGPNSPRSYRPVPMTPLIVPGITASPLVTWGEVMSTPMVLPSDSSEQRSFTMASPSSRETLARSMDIKRRRQPPQEKTMISKLNESTRLRLTPAALSLAARIRASSTPMSVFGGDSALSRSYSTAKKRKIA